MSRLQQPKAFLFVANFAAPSLMKSDQTTCALSMMAHMMTSERSTDSCGLLLCSIFSHKSTQLFHDDYAICKQISGTNCQVDTFFQLNFDVKSKTDS